ncbi:MAG: murein L,D-transpeptidase family protein [Thermoanaerobaculaceae bacterium]
MAPLAVLLAWANHAVAPLPEGTRATRVLVEKRARRLTLLRDAEVLRSYRIALGGRPEGHKLREGDNRTPEGVYRIDWRNPNSGWHLSLHLSYPDEADRARAAAAGVPPGGDILIHGLHNGFWWIGRLHRRRDWTRGCIAVTDPEIEEIWRVVPNGTPIEIRP